MNSIRLVLAVLAAGMGCVDKSKPLSKEDAAKVVIRLNNRLNENIAKAIAPIDRVDFPTPCDSGSMQTTTMGTTGAAGTAVTIDFTFSACQMGDEKLSGNLRLTSTVATTPNTIAATVVINGTLAYEGPTYAGNFSFNDLSITRTITTAGGRTETTVRLTGAVSIGGTSYPFNDEVYTVVTCVSFGSCDLISGGTGGGGGGGGAAGGGVSGGGNAGGSAMAAILTGASNITDLAPVGETVYFTGEVSQNQPAIFSATDTSTAATVLCTGPMNAKLAGLVVDGTALYALVSTATGMTKIVRGSTTGTGGTCSDVAQVDTRSFSFSNRAPMAKVGDLLVYKANDGSLKGYSLTANNEVTVAPGPAGMSFFDDIISSGPVGVVAQTVPGATLPPDLKTFTAAGLGETLASFSKPDFTVLGAHALWAIDGVTFQRRQLMPAGSAVEAGATANLGVTGRAAMGFCETNWGSAAGFFLSKSAGTNAGYYTVSADSSPPRKVTNLAFDTPVHCTVTPTKLWLVEADLGGTRRLLRVDR